MTLQDEGDKLLESRAEEKEGTPRRSGEKKGGLKVAPKNEEFYNTGLQTLLDCEPVP